ncbi:MAG: hypothetical protein HY314_13625 [Acidobacteria bacterium]|nr:hypothetical protein [Acidobacteriota bacterium]
MADNSKRWQATLMVISVFVLGFVAGGLSVNYYHSRAEGKIAAPSPHQHANPEQVIQKLTKELNLTAEQSQVIRQILAETRQEYSKLRQEARPRFHAIREQSRSRIRATLNPDQQAKFDEWVRRRDELYDREHRWKE